MSAVTTDTDGHEGDSELSYHDEISDTSELREFEKFMPSREEIMEERSAERKRKTKSKNSKKNTGVTERTSELFLTFTLYAGSWN